MKITQDTFEREPDLSLLQLTSIQGKVPNVGFTYEVCTSDWTSDEKVSRRSARRHHSRMEHKCIDDEKGTLQVC